MPTIGQDGKWEDCLSMTLTVLELPDFEKILPYLKLSEADALAVQEYLPFLTLNELDNQAVGSPLLSIRQYVRHMFDFGPEAAYHMYLRMEKAVKVEEVVIKRLEIPSELPAGVWMSENLVASLLFVLASPKAQMAKELAPGDEIQGIIHPTIETVGDTPWASLRQAYNEAKEVATKETRTTLIRVELSDLLLAAEEEIAKEVFPNELPNIRVSFARTFVMGVGPEGTIVWMTGGKLGGASFEEYCKQDRDRVLSENEVNRFVTDFEKLTVDKVNVFSSCNEEAF
jgi:hypothetical protein